MHTARRLARRDTTRASTHALEAKRSKLQEEELLHAIAQLRSELRNWDRASRPTRKGILERFLWLHSPEGAGIGAPRELLRDEPEQKEALATPPQVILLTPSTTGPNSLANASLESLYGAGASLLLMRITSWLRLTYTLHVANLLNLRAIAAFCEDASGGLRFVHEFVEAGGILTLLSIIEAGAGSVGGGPGLSSTRDLPTRDLTRDLTPRHTSNDSASASAPAPVSTHHDRKSSFGDGHFDPPPLSAEAAAAHAAELIKHQANQEQIEIEKERSLSILLRISLTGRAFKEMICDSRGVAIIIACLATVAREQTQEVAKQLLCQLGLGNPRYASLVHEELLSVFRSHSSNSCKRMVLQTLHFLLSNTTSSQDAPTTAALQQPTEYDSIGNLIMDHFTADARYVDATVSLYHINDFHLHYEANQLLKLLITKHQLQESALIALLALLKAKSQNALSPANSQTHRSTGIENEQDGLGSFGADSSGGASPANGSSSRPLPAGSKLRDRGQKQSDPKTCAVKLLNELALVSYELCLRMTQLGVINLLLDGLCNMTNYELQHWSCVLLYTLNNNVVEAASLIRFMMSGASPGGPISVGAASEGLYLEFLKNPEQLHRHITYADVKKIQHNLHHPQTQTSFLSQRRLERRQGSRRGSSIGGGIGPINGGPPDMVRRRSLAQGVAVFTPSPAPGSSRSRKNSFNFQVADPAAAQAHFNAAAAQAAGSATNSPHLAPYPILTSPTPTMLARVPSSPAFQGFYSIPAHNLEDDDAAFFAHGMATVARASEADELDLQLRAERAAEKSRLQAEKVEEASPSQEPVSDVALTPRSRRVADTITVPATQLHFDSKLRLVDEGQPKTYGIVAAMRLATAVPFGHHEGLTTGSKEAGLDETGQLASLIYAPFAHASPPPPVPQATNNSAGAAQAQAAQAAAAQAQLVFSQRVGLPSHRELRTDPASEAYTSIHFKDLMHSSRSQYLQHGRPGLMDSLNPAARTGRSGAEVSDEPRSSLMLPDAVPHVEVLDLHDVALLSKKHELAKAAELLRRRDEKRLNNAQLAAAAAAQHALDTKYAKPGDKYSGFTAATMSKPKTANEFGTKKVSTLEQERKRLADLDALQKHMADRALAQVVADAQAAALTAANISTEPSHRSVLQMAIRLDNTGRTIDPKRWLAHRASKSISPIKGIQLTPLPGESEADTAERLKIEAELQELRNGGAQAEDSDEEPFEARPPSSRDAKSQQRRGTGPSSHFHSPSLSTATSPTNSSGHGAPRHARSVSSLIVNVTGSPGLTPRMEPPVFGASLSTARKAHTLTPRGTGLGSLSILADDAHDAGTITAPVRVDAARPSLGRAPSHKSQAAILRRSTVMVPSAGSFTSRAHGLQAVAAASLTARKRATSVLSPPLNHAPKPPAHK